MIDIFFDIVFAAVIFSRMGDGKNSGNLIFKKIFSGSNFNIIDGETGITFSTSGGGGVEADKIAWGTGTGITSSTFYVSNSTNQESILGLSSIRNDHDLTKGSYVDPSSPKSFIVGGDGNNISGSSAYSIILGGKTHSIINSNSSVILAGCNNYINGFCTNTFIGSECVKIRNSYSSSIISSTSSCITCNKYSSIISSKGSCILGGQPIEYNSNNIIISSSGNIICNKSFLDGVDNYYAYLCSNSILTSNTSCITLESVRGEKGDLTVNPGDNVMLNTILSSKKSCIDNKYTGPNNTTNYNLVLSSNESCNSSNFSIISGRFNRIKACDYDKDNPSDLGKYSQILGGCCNFLRTYMSSIISSINSTMSVGSIISASTQFNQIIGGSNHYIPHITSNNIATCGMHYNSIIGGDGNKITSINTGGWFPFGDNTDEKLSTHFSTILGGDNNCANGYSLIVGGSCNTTGAFAHNGIIGELKVFGATVSDISDYKTGMIFGGCQNSAFKFSTIIGGSNNESIKRGSIIGGCKNCSGFQYNQSYCSLGEGVFIEGPRFFGAPSTSIFCFHGVTSSHSSFILGGCNNCTTSDLTSIIIGGNENITRNVNDSIIIGGSCNHIKAHGDFSGLTAGLSHSEISAIYTLCLQSKPNFDTSNMLANHIGSTSWPTGDNCLQTQVSNNFIIGGKCNRFKSCFPNNYNCSSPYGYQSFNDFYKTISIDYGPAGLSNSSTSFVANSGIVGGYRNCILNTYNLMGGIGGTLIPGSEGKYGGRLINSVILGGQNLILSKSNMVCASESILVNSVLIVNVGSFCSGFSGTVNNPTTICIKGGLITCVI